MMYTMYEGDVIILIRPLLRIEKKNPPRHCPSWRGFFNSLEEAKHYAAVKFPSKPLHVIEA